MVIQNERNDCGKAAVRIVLSEVFSDDSYGVVPLETDCHSFLDIQKEFSKFGIKSQGMICDVIPDNIVFPFIAQVKNGDYRHFVVVKKIGKKKVKIIDPEFSDYTLSLDDFYEVFLKKIICIEKTEKKPLKPKTNLLQKAEITTYILLFLGQFSTAFSFFWFMNKTGDFITKIILIIAFLSLVVCQIILNSLVKKRIDDEVVIPFLKVTNFSEDYDHLEKIAVMEINRASTLISYGVVCLLSLVILSTNGLFVMLLGLIGLIFPISKIFSHQKFNEMARSISFEESQMKKEVECQSDFSFSLKKVISQANVFKNTYICGYIIEIALISLLIIGQMVMTKENSLNYYMFYLFLSLGFSSFASKIIDTYLEKGSLLREINALSYSLSSFFVKNSFPLGYNNNTVGGKADGTNFGNSRLSGQDKSKKRA
ncbi:MAG: cysteine peptidase family C39 domain-containing protein [Bacilli bacterium]